MGTVTVMSLLMTAVYGGDTLLRLGFELFIGSSIFLAFFMVTDPATTPLTYAGQVIFGAGVGVLTVVIQTYMNFLRRLNPRTCHNEPNFTVSGQRGIAQTYCGEENTYSSKSQTI